MSWHPLEVDLLGGLEALADAQGPRYVIGPAGHETPEALASLLTREARGFHETELDVERTRAMTIAKQLEALAPTEEVLDRAGSESGPAADIGYEGASAALTRCRARIRAHEARLAWIASGDVAVEVEALLAHFVVRPRADLAALRADPDAHVAELFADGYGLRPAAERRGARRELLGLPDGADWR